MWAQSIVQVLLKFKSACSDYIIMTLFQIHKKEICPKVEVELGFSLWTYIAYEGLLKSTEKT